MSVSHESLVFACVPDWTSVQLWTIGNYHWYLKHEIVAPKLTSVQWHPESILHLILTTQGGSSLPRSYLRSHRQRY